MMKLCSSVPDMKLTRDRQENISGWANPHQTRKRGKSVTMPGIRSTTMDSSERIE